MMKRMSKYAQPGRILALLLCLLLLIGMLPSFGALGAKKKSDAARKNNTGTLNVSLTKEISDRLSGDAKAGVAFTLYQIGKAAPETAAGWTIDSDFSNYKILQAKNSEDLGKKAEALAKVITAGKYKGTTKALSKDGVATFTGLPYGVYLGVMTQAPEGLSATPFIVTVPSKDPETKQVRYDYDVIVKAEITDVRHDAVKIVKKETVDERPLQGVEFTLYDGTTEIKTFTTDEKGELTIDTADEALAKYLPKPGESKTLTLKETKTATGYLLSDREFKVVISAKSKITANAKRTKANKSKVNTAKINTTIYTITIEGEKTLTVWNEPKTGQDEGFKAVVVKKVDGQGKLLPGAEFTLYDGTTAIKTYTSGSDGTLSIATSDEALAKYLPEPGQSRTLTLVETKAPTGYVKTATNYKVVLSTHESTDWDNKGATLMTVVSYDIKIEGKESVTVVNKPQTTTPTVTPTATPTTRPSATPTTRPSATPTTTPTDAPTPPPEGGGGGGDVPQPTAVPTVDISGTKVWDDEGNVHKVRPDSIEVKLLADGSPVNAEPSWSKSGDRWTFTFSGLPKVDSTGNEISYTVVETPVDMYETSISGLTITNKLIEKEPTRQTEISGEKTWKDNDNAKGKRPTSITVHLLRDGVEIDKRTVTAGTGWKYTFGDLPVDDGYGNVYTYELREDGVPGYYSRVDGTNLINSLIDGSTPPTPTDDDETPPPGGTTPNTPEKPEDIPERKSGTPVPQFEDKSDEELEELFDIFGYNTPLYGILGTGDQIPVWVWVCVGIGIAAIILFIVLGRKKKRRR